MELNQFLRPKNSLANINEKQIPERDFERFYDVDTKKLKGSRLDVERFVELSNIGSAQATFTDGQTVLLTSTFKFSKPNQRVSVYAVPFVSVYQGTVAGTAKIFPTSGTAVTPTAYQATGGLDWGSSSGATVSVWSGQVNNISAGTQTIIFLSQWKYINYNAAIGTSS